MKGFLYLSIGIITLVGLASCSKKQTCVTCTNSSSIHYCKVCLSSSNHELSRTCATDSVTIRAFVANCTGSGSNYVGDTTDIPLITTNNCYDAKDNAVSEKATKEALGQTCTLQ